MSEFRIFCAGVHIAVLPALRIRNILLNVADNGRNRQAVISTKNLLKITRPEKIILDSSGYQILQSEVEGKSMTFDSDLPVVRTKDQFNIAPAHVVKAALHIQPDIMIALDFPIRSFSERGDQEREYLSKSGVNARWAREIGDLREVSCPHIEFFLPIHCYTLQQLEHYLNLIKGISYEGVSMPVRDQTFSGLALFFVKFRSLGIKKVHLLGTCSFSWIALSSYLARHYFLWLSLDATNWRLSAQNNNYLNPFDLSNIRLTGGLLEVEDLPMTCQCPACQNMNFEAFKNLPNGERKGLLQSHNFYVTERIAEDLYKHTVDLTTFEKFLKSRTEAIFDLMGTENLRRSQRSRTRRLEKVTDLVKCISKIDLNKDADPEFLESQAA